MLQAEKIPLPLLKKYCLKGKEEFEDFFLIDTPIKERVHFSVANLIEPLPDLGLFEVIFLRNVMIYFDRDTQLAVLRRFAPLLKPDGLLFVGHSENFYHATDLFRLRGKTVYERVSKA